MAARINSSALESAHTSIYVDMENLGGKGRELLTELLSNWPKKAPQPSSAHLYVPSDQVGLWTIWGEGRFPNVEIVPHGVQHYSNNSTKNSADVALAIDAMTDLLIGKTDHVSILSDDSDFLAVYAAMVSRPDMPMPDESPPFLLIVTGDKGKQSETIRTFVPPEHLHVIGSKTPARAKSPNQESSVAGKESDYEEMAKKLIQELPLGPFKSTDCQDIIKHGWPTDPLAQASGPSFGVEFKSKIWPHLEKAGARIPNPNAKPLKYEMPSAAKQNV